MLNTRCCTIGMKRFDSMAFGLKQSILTMSFLHFQVGEPVKPILFQCALYIILMRPAKVFNFSSSATAHTLMMAWHPLQIVRSFVRSVLTNTYTNLAQKRANRTQHQYVRL